MPGSTGSHRSNPGGAARRATRLSAGLVGHFDAHPRPWLWGFLGLFVLVSLLLFDPKLHTGGDNARYLILAHSLAGGGGYSDLHLPGSPPHTKCPPVFPAMLIPAAAVGGIAGLMVGKAVVFVTGLGAALFFFWIARRLLGKQALPALVLYVSLPILAVYNHWVLSEIPFLCLALGGILFLLKAEPDGHAGTYALAFTFGLLAAFTRTAGAVLVLAMLMSLGVRRRFAQLGVLLIAALVLAAVWLARSAEAGGTPYLAELLATDPYTPDLGRASAVGLTQRLWENLQVYVGSVMPAAFLPLVKARWLAVGTGVLVTAGIALGFVGKPRRWGVVEFLGFTAVPVLLLWPSVWTSERFLLPFLPVAVLLLVRGWSWAARRVRVALLPLLLTGLVVVPNLVFIGIQARAAIGANLWYVRGDRNAGYPPDWRRFFELLGWVADNTPESAVIMARKPEFVYLLTGRRSLGYPLTRDETEFREAIGRCDYVLSDNFLWTGTSRRLLNPVLQNEPGRYKVLARTGPPVFSLLGIGVADEQARGVRAVPGGGYIIGGFSNSLGSGSYDFFAVRLDAERRTVWTHTYGGEAEDQAYDVELSSDGGFVLCGHSRSVGPEAQYLMLVKVDSLGNETWHAGYGNEGQTCGYAVCRTPDGGYAAAGHTRASDKGNTDMYLVVCDSEGRELWSRTYLGPRWEQCYDIAPCLDGGFLLVGSGYQPRGHSDLLALRVDGRGDVLWAKTHGGPGDDEAYAAVQTADGGFVVTGRTSSRGNGGYDIWVLKLDAAGDTVWTRTFGGPEQDAARAVIEVPGQGCTVTGYDNLTGFSVPNMVAVELDTLGNQLSYRILGEKGTAAGYGICLGPGPDLLYGIAGVTNSFEAVGLDIYFVLVRARAARESRLTRQAGLIACSE